MDQDEPPVAVATGLETYEAEMIRGLLEMAGIQAYIAGGGVRVYEKHKAAALAIIADTKSRSETYVCEQCGEEAPPGFAECPMCAELRPAAIVHTTSLAELTASDDEPKKLVGGGLVADIISALIEPD